MRASFFMFRTLIGKIHPTVFLKAAKAAAHAVSEDETRLVELCSLTPGEALAHLGVNEHGLSPEAVEAAKEKYGLNLLSHKKELGIVMELLLRCKNPLVIQLLVICICLLYTSPSPRD